MIWEVIRAAEDVQNADGGNTTGNICTYMDYTDADRQRVRTFGDGVFGAARGLSGDGLFGDGFMDLHNPVTLNSIKSLNCYYRDADLARICPNVDRLTLRATPSCNGLNLGGDGLIFGAAGNTVSTHGTIAVRLA